MEHFTPLKLSINNIFNTINDQPWVRRPRPIQHNPSFSRSEEYYSYHDCKWHQAVTVGPSEGPGGALQQDLFKEYILTPEAAS